MSSPYDRLGRELAEGLGEGPSDERRAARRRRLLEQHLEQTRNTAGWRWRPLVWGLAGATAVVLAALVIFPWVAAPPLECRTASGQQLTEGTWVGSRSSAESRLTFSEGSEVVLRPGGRLRVSRLGRKEVDITLKSGVLESTVRSSGRATWRFHAGPYRAVVVGTQLSIAWESASEQLTVGVTHGIVRVTGGNIDVRGLAVTTGQRLTADANRGRVELLDVEGAATGGDDDQPAVDADVGVDASGAALDAAALAPTPPDARTTPRGSRPPLKTRALRRLLKGQDYAAIVTEAQRLQLGRLLEGLSAADLLLLADAMRLGGTPPEARRVLLAVRRRFVGQRAARDAAFRLGRLAWDRRRDYAQAARWFEAYLREGPTTVLVADAEGRLMIALARSGQRRRAQKIALQYLERYPSGDYAPAARALLGGEGGGR